MTSAPVQLRPVEDRTLRAQAARQIVDLVTGGHLRPGQKLTETALAAQLQVSRGPLREALRELADKGILVSQPYKGLRVRPISRHDLQELYSMRTNLERFAFTLAWPLRSPAALDDLAARYAELMSAQKTGDQARVIALEIAFHSWVYEICGHGLLRNHWERLAPLVQIYMSLHHELHGAHGQFKHMTREYQRLARGNSLQDMLDHIDRHMAQGLDRVMSAVLETTG